MRNKSCLVSFFSFSAPNVTGAQIEASTDTITIVASNSTLLPTTGFLDGYCYDNTTGYSSSGVTFLDADNTMNCLEPATAYNIPIYGFLSECGVISSPLTTIIFNVCTGINFDFIIVGRSLRDSLMGLVIYFFRVSILRIRRIFLWYCFETIVFATQP